LKVAIAARNVEHALSATRNRISDLALSLNCDQAVMDRVYARSLTQAGNFSVNLCSTSDLLLVAEAECRLFWAKSRDGGGALRTLNEAGTGEIPTGLMNAQGKWIIIR
jgi:hypothetical protein